jgi:hypothetical protein
VYAREIDGQVYDFGVSGKLIMNVLVMYDRQTESYWSQLLGEAVKGELAGTKLEFVTSWFTTWQQWKERNPTTVALDKGGQSRDNYSSYYSSDDAGILGETFGDDRLNTKAFIIGVENNGKAVAYAFRHLFNQPLVNDVVGNLPIVIVFLEDGETGMVYDRRVDGRELTFSFDPETVELRDLDTNTLWDAWRGIGLNGELEGEILDRVPSTRSFWFGWKDWYPDTDVWEP